MEQDNRRRARVPVGLSALISTGGRTVAARIINLSLTGILCTADPGLEKDASCTVVIPLGETFKIEVEGKVIRVGEGQAAVSFVSMDEESFGHLRRLVAYNTGDADRIEGEVGTKAFS